MTHHCTSTKGTRVSKSSPAAKTGLLPFVTAALVAFLAIVAAPALAARGHEYLGETIGTPCAAEPCAPGTLKDPEGVAVNEATAQVYVVDKGNNWVQRFSSIGAWA